MQKTPLHLSHVQNLPQLLFVPNQRGLYILSPPRKFKVDLYLGFFKKLRTAFCASPCLCLRIVKLQKSIIFVLLRKKISKST